MIHHISIAAHNPQHVAEVLAELFQGKSSPFSNHPGGYVAFNFDQYGTIVEVHPLYTELIPGSEDDPVSYVQNPDSSIYTATHAAISVPVSEDEIRAIAVREGWRMKRFNRGNFFDVIEFWLENKILIELLPPTLTADYLAFMEPQNLKQFITTMAQST